MNKKIVFQITTIIIALLASVLFLFCDFGFGITPLSKFFIIFFGIIVGLQCIPATLLFIGMIKGIFNRSEETERVLH
jgi:hypothetical protein